MPYFPNLRFKSDKYKASFKQKKECNNLGSNLDKGCLKGSNLVQIG